MVALGGRRSIEYEENEGQTIGDLLRKG